MSDYNNLPSNLTASGENPYEHPFLQTFTLSTSAGSAGTMPYDNAPFSPVEYDNTDNTAPDDAAAEYDNTMSPASDPPGGKGKEVSDWVLVHTALRLTGYVVSPSLLLWRLSRKVGQEDPVSTSSQ